MWVVSETVNSNMQALRWFTTVILRLPLANTYIPVSVLHVKTLITCINCLKSQERIPHTNLTKSFLCTVLWFVLLMVSPMHSKTFMSFTQEHWKHTFYWLLIIYNYTLVECPEWSPMHVGGVLSYRGQSTGSHADGTGIGRDTLVRQAWEVNRNL